MARYKMRDRIKVTRGEYWGYHGRVIAITYTNPLTYDLQLDNLSKLIQGASTREFENE